MNGWNLIPIGAKVEINGKEPVQGIVINWLTDDSKEIIGYLVELKAEPPMLKLLVTCDLDDNIKVIA